MLKLILILPLLATISFAQSITVTTPAAAATISGFNYTLACTLTSAPSATAVSWYVDGNLMGVQQTQPLCTLPWSTANILNGPHVVKAIATDALGTVVATSSEVAFTTANSIYYNNFYQGQTGNSFNTTLACTPSTSVASPWSGTVTVSCTFGGTWYQGATSGNIVQGFVYIDDVLQTSTSYGPTTTNLTGLSWNTTRAANGVHKVAIVVRAGDSTNVYASWQREVTLANGASAMELRASAREIFLCTTSQTNCPTSATLTGTVVNTDGTTSAATISSCTVNNTAVATKSGTCTITQASLGVTYVTMTDSGSRTRQVWIWVQGQNSIANIGTDRLIHQNYASTSVFIHDMFLAGVPSGTALADYKAIGHNTGEIGGVPTLTRSYQGSTQASFESAQNSYITSTCNDSATAGLYLFLTGDNAASHSEDLWASTRGTIAGYTTPGLTYIMNRWAACGRALGMDWVDEVQGNFGLNPQFPVPSLGSGNVTSVTCTTSPNTCTVVWPNFCPNYCTFNNGHSFIISGSATSGMNTPAGSTYTWTKVNANTFTFPNPGVGVVTLNSGNDPGWTIQPFGVAWYNGNSDYVRWDAFQVFMNFVHAGVSGKPPSSWPNSAQGSSDSIQNWEFNPNQSDSATLYITPDYDTTYLADRASLYSEIHLSPDALRGKMGHSPTPIPVIAETDAIETDYGVVSTPFSVTSCSGDTITLSSAHGLGSPRSGISRIAIAGSSGGSCNGNFVIISSPTTTSLKVVRATGGPGSSGSFANGTATFQDTTTFTVSIDNHASGGPNGYSVIRPASDAACNWQKKRGQTFVITGTTLGPGWTGPDINGQTQYAAPWSPINCTQEHFLEFYAVPSLSGTGGTAKLFADNYYIRGRDSAWPGRGISYQFGQPLQVAIFGASGQRAYSYAVNGVGAQQHNDVTGQFPQLVESINGQYTDDTDATGLQAGPIYAPDSRALGSVFWARGNANLIITARLPYLFQTRLPSPDYGKTMECTARTGTPGNMLLCKSFLDNTQTFTFDLSPYLISGQQIVQDYIAPAGIQTTVIAAGTTSATVTLAPGAAIWFTFPTTFAGAIQPRTISARLADAENATKIVVSYAYTQYPLFDQQTDYPPFTVDCGDGSACALPVDRGIGPVYYRISYLNSGGVVIARGDVQIL